MISAWLCPFRSGSFWFACAIWLSAAVYASPAHSETCSLPSLHAGVTFPLEQIEPSWACRLQPIISHYTTANKLGPLRTPLPEAVYLYLLDHPPMAASLINRLGIAPYQSEMRGSGRYWGNDGEGTEGLVQLVYQDRTSRIYYLEGSHDSRFLPHITGKAVVLLRMNQVTDSHGAEAMESTLVYYTRLDNRFLSGIVSLLRPLVGSMVTRKLARGVDSVNRLSLAMKQQPDRLLSEAATSPALSSGDMDFLKQALESLSHSGGTTTSRTVAP
ncbi:MAG: hypothetical protein RL042_2314 [Nitrospirota bacterium]|jgi:hypothetical protein